MHPTAKEENHTDIVYMYIVFHLSTRRKTEKIYKRNGYLPVNDVMFVASDSLKQMLPRAARLNAIGISQLDYFPHISSPFRHLGLYRLRSQTPGHRGFQTRSNAHCSDLNAKLYIRSILAVPPMLEVAVGVLARECLFWMYV